MDSIGLNLIRKVKANNIPEVKKILEEQPNVVDYNIDGWTALLWASNLRFQECLQLLLEAGANPDIKNNNIFGATALILASIYGYTECVSLLLQYKANPDIQNNKGDTALIFAIKNKHTECVRLLLRAGANFILKNKEGNTAYDLAQNVSQNEPIQKLLENAMKLMSLMPFFVQSYRGNFKFDKKEGFIKKIIDKFFSMTLGEQNKEIKEIDKEINKIKFPVELVRKTFDMLFSKKIKKSKKKIHKNKNKHKHTKK